MAVEFNHDTVMKMFEQKRKRFLTQTGIMGANLAAINSRVDTGASQNAKQYRLVGVDKVNIEAPMEYDLYLERRYGVLAKTQQQLNPFIRKFEEENF